MTIHSTSSLATSGSPINCHRLVLFGALGDLALRKLLPALFKLYQAKMLEDFYILGVARRPISRVEFVDQVAAALHNYLTIDSQDKRLLGFLDRLDYQEMHMDQPQSYALLAQRLGQADTPTAFYLATPPGLFGTISQGLHQAGMIHPKARIVIEKPLGVDLTSSQQINDTVGQVFNEQQIYRIDHYLGKETVQNLLPLRFANPIFKRLWHQDHIAYVEINVAETVGIEGRWGYFDEAGQVRDMVQNHLLQLLSLVAMEPPARLDEKAIRDEKVKLLESLRPYDRDTVKSALVLGQYTAGQINEVKVPGYLQEADANTHSHTETFMALKVTIDNDRWASTPFYLRTGKRLAAKTTEIKVHFKPETHKLWHYPDGRDTSNCLVIRLQPAEGISLQMATKTLGLRAAMDLEEAEVQLDLTQGHQVAIPDAYERLLLDVLQGNQSQFVRRDEVEAAWRWCDQLRAAWLAAEVPLEPYAAGSDGPEAAQKLLQRCQAAMS